ncbi:MAG TPA: twin-arginine translocation signal domain-containing protein [Planctomycetota bacterium]|nr:twin-arginine translocation signal domain-containing protein [Planctomycetota bacterium]
MDRRQFLGKAAGTVAGAGAIGWLGHYFLGKPAWAGDDASKDAIAAMGNVADAYRRAHGLGKPLLVLVIPKNDEQKRGRGHVFGEALNHGGNDLYLDLALCELVCAPVPEVTKQLKDVKVNGEPLMLLVETGGGAARVVPVDVDVRYENGYRDGTENADEAAKQRVEKVAAALRAAIAPDRETLAARAALAEKRLPADDVRAIRNALAAKIMWSDELLDRGAAIVRLAKETPDVAKQNALLERLAAVAKKRVTGAPPPGAKWAKECGCGTEIDGGEPEAIACGMGFVPKISQRFLWFFTK